LRQFRPAFPDIYSSTLLTAYVDDLFMDVPYAFPTLRCCASPVYPPTCPSPCRLPTTFAAAPSGFMTREPREYCHYSCWPKHARLHIIWRRAVPSLPTCGTQRPAPSYRRHLLLAGMHPLLPGACDGLDCLAFRLADFALPAYRIAAPMPILAISHGSNGAPRVPHLKRLGLRRRCARLGGACATFSS